MSRLWSAVVEGLTPYVPGEQPHVADLVKLNTNESPFGPSPKALEAIRAAATDDLRLYPDFDATELRETLAAYHDVKPEQVFLGNGSDEVLGHTFAALLKHETPLLFPDVTYSFYPVYCRLFAIAQPRADVETLLSEHPDIPVVVDEAYVDFGGETAIPLILAHPNLLVVRTMSKSRALAGLRVGYALGDAGLIEALHRVKDSFNSYPLGRPAQAGAIASVKDEAYFQATLVEVLELREKLNEGL